MGRGTVRGILIFIILLTIPCYMVAIGTWLLSPDPNARDATPTEFLTFTPIDPDTLPTRNATTTPIFGDGGDFVLTLIGTDVQTGLTPLVPTSDSFQPVVPTAFLPTIVPTFTPLPTATPTATLAPTITPTSTPTFVPLPPPTDTPAP